MGAWKQDPAGPETLRGPGGATGGELLVGDPRARARIHLPARPGRSGQWPVWLDPTVRAALQARGIATPWRHQVRAAEAAWSGQHVVISTGTASGKSVAFGMPALTAALEPAAGLPGRGRTVLYLSPTKALAHDQLRSLTDLGLGLRAAGLDGDTDLEARRWARAHARWLATNPDMLNAGILPDHERWRSFLRGLSFVVVDEAHVYRGVFGAHVGLVLRRLHRLAVRHGASPVFVAASATVADPGSHVARLLGVDVVAVTDDDSARAPVEIVLWDPASGSPAVSEARGSRGSALPPGSAPSAEPGVSPGPAGTAVSAARAAAAGSAAASAGQRDLGEPESDEDPHDSRGPGAVSAAADLMAHLVDAGTTTLTFTRSRRAAEVVAARVRRTARRGDHVRAYRGGYLPEERRALEDDLRSGALMGLAATTALELGIDISGLDAVVMAGWPGTRSSFWQQVGRAGRRGSPALAVLVAREDPLDQYVIGHPEMLEGRSVEGIVLDPGNPYVLAGHLCAAAVEAPLTAEDLRRWFPPSAEGLCTALTEQGLLRRRPTGWYWTRGTSPNDLIDLRGTGGGPVRVVEAGTGSLLGTVDAPSAAATVHPGAIYVHQGATFEVGDLDLERCVATATPTVTDLTTQARTTADVVLTREHSRESWGSVDLCWGEVRVIRQVRSYLIRRWPSGQVLGERPLMLPPSELATMAVWWSIPEDTLRDAGVAQADVAGALHALEHAAIAMLPLVATCDRRDIGGVSIARHPQTGQALVVIHDGHPGGAGFSERGYQAARPWLAATVETIAACRCSAGCPRCVQSPSCGNGNLPLDKAASLRLGEILLLTR